MRYSDHLLSFVEYCTCIAACVRCGRACWISSQEQPSPFILNIVSYSSGSQRTRFPLARNFAGCTLKCRIPREGRVCATRILLLMKIRRTWMAVKAMVNRSTTMSLINFLTPRTEIGESFLG
jgi:hypothetical protein